MPGPLGLQHNAGGWSATWKGFRSHHQPGPIRALLKAWGIYRRAESRRLHYEVIDGSRTIRANMGRFGIWLAWWQFGHPFLIHRPTIADLDARFDGLRRTRYARRTQRLARRQRH
jgi:hypothetical protein